MDALRADDTLLRRVHLVVLAIPLGLVLVLWVLVGTPDAFRMIVFPGVAVVHGTLLAGLLTGRLTVRQTAPWVVVSPAVVLVARLLVWELVPTSRPEDLGLVVAAVAWFGVLAALAFLVFGTRRGVIVSLVGFALVEAGAAWSSVDGMLADAGTGRGPIAIVVFLAAGHVALVGVLWVLARDVEHLAAVRTRAQVLEEQATTDPLTGVANRRRLDDELQRLVAAARRYDQPLSVVLVDLDEFKAVNDTHGHEVGDQVLVATVRSLAQAVREADLLGRWGGEEFLLLAPVTDHEAACVLAERCRRLVADARVARPGVAVTASFGVATLAADDDARALMRRADLALYTAKREGRDRVVGMAEVGSLEDLGTPPAPRPAVDEA